MNKVFATSSFSRCFNLLSFFIKGWMSLLKGMSALHQQISSVLGTQTKLPKPVKNQVQRFAMPPKEEMRNHSFLPSLSAIRLGSSHSLALLRLFFQKHLFDQLSNIQMRHPCKGWQWFHLVET